MHPFDFLDDDTLATAHIGRLEGLDEGLQFFLECMGPSASGGDSAQAECPCLPWEDCSCEASKAG